MTYSIHITIAGAHPVVASVIQKKMTHSPVFRIESSEIATLPQSLQHVATIEKTNVY